MQLLYFITTVTSQSSFSQAPSACGVQCSTERLVEGWIQLPSGADRHLDITFGLQVVEGSSLVSVLFREAFSHPNISFFHLLVNGFSVTCQRVK